MRARCPECGQPVKEENLGDHVANVHPSIPRRRYKEMQIRPPPASPALKWVPVVAVVLAAILAGALYVATLPPSSGNSGVPRFYAPTKTYDFGHVPQITVEHNFTIENRGWGDLKILDLSSSCDCTSSHMIIRGVQSPHFGMHEKPSWTGTIYPGTSATLVVLYDATQMPDLYVGPRSVYVRTNDPANPEVEFVITVHEA